MEYSLLKKERDAISLQSKHDRHGATLKGFILWLGGTDEEKEERVERYLRGSIPWRKPFSFEEELEEAKKYIKRVALLSKNEDSFSL